MSREYGGPPPEVTKKDVDLDELTSVTNFWIERWEQEAETTTSEAIRKGRNKQVEKFEKMRQMLESLRGKIYNEGESTVDFLTRQQKNLNEQMAKSSDEKYQDHLMAESAVYDDTIDFIIQQQENPCSSAAYRQWKEEKSNVIMQMPEQPLVQPTRMPTVEKKVESEKERKEAELLQQAFNQGGFKVCMSWPQKYSSNGYTSGFKTRYDNRRLDSQTGGMQWAEFQREFNIIKENTMDDLRLAFEKRGINEAVAITPIMEDIYQEVEVLKTEYKFGVLPIKKNVKEKRKVGQQPKKHEQLVEGGSGEPLYEIMYCAIGSNSGSGGYRDAGGRFGNILMIEAALPKSVAEKVFAQTKADPKFIRSIIEKVMLERIGLPQKAWEQGDEYSRYPMRPPYQEWDKQPGGSKMYIKEPGDDYGFKPERVVPVKS